MPKVSVIVPVYGVEKYIERCARSLFEQTLDDIEYLFIDDCTPDRSIEILRQVLEDYPQRKPQVTIHRMEQNSGQAAVRKWGMQNATGEYVIHCDSDDWVDRDMYRAMYEKAKEDGADVVVCDYYINNGKDNTYVNAFARTDKKGFLEDMLAMRVSWALWNKLVRRGLCDIVYPLGAMGEDMAITTQNVYHCNRLSFIRKAFYFYVINPASITQVKDKDSVLNKYNQFIGNSIIAISLLEQAPGKAEYKNAVVALKWDAKMLIWQEVRNKDIYKLWKNTFSEINVGVLFCPLIKLSDKMKYLISYIHLYPKA